MVALPWVLRGRAREAPCCLVATACPPGIPSGRAAIDRAIRTGRYTSLVPTDSETRLLQDIGRLVRDGRLAARWTQQELERRSGVSQSRLSRIERGECRSVRFVEVDRLFVAVGVRYRLDVSLPPGHRVVDDAVHVRCATAVQRRLEVAGWVVRREVEIGSDRSRGWIDVLAFHPATRLLLVIEIKTELHDLGAVERSLNWYVREAARAAAGFGWRPTAVASALLVLATDANDQAMRSIRPVLSVALPGRAIALRDLVGTGRSSGPQRFVATIDPRSRRRQWLMPTILDGRRSPAPYADYIDAALQLESQRASPRATAPSG
jgi:transcriptional regulator with XRE-family HTH domain